MKSSGSRASGGHQLKKFKKGEPKLSGFHKQVEHDDYDYQNNDKRVHIDFQAGQHLKDDFNLEDWK